MHAIFFLVIGSLAFASLQTGAVSQPFAMNTGRNGLLSISFNLPDSSITTANGYSKICPSHESRTTEDSQPDFPVYTTMIQTDPGKSYDVEMIVTRSHQLSDFFPLPSKSGGNPESPDLSGFEYPADQGIFPAQFLRSSNPMVLRGNHLIQLSIIPFRYHFDSKLLEVIDEAEIQITELNVTAPAVPAIRMRSRAFDPLLSTMVINYIPGDDNEYQQPSILYICGGNALSNPAFQNLLQWRRERGYIVYTAETSDIGSNVPDIENYIHDAYNTFTPSPEFVALVGDTGGPYAIPTYYEHWSLCSYNVPCLGEGDFPYTQIEGNDLLPEMLIGRISIRTSTDLTIISAKILNYENGVDNYPGWYEKAALAANPEIYGNGLSIVTTSEYILDLMETNGMENITLNVQPNMAALSYWMNNQLSQGVAFMNFRGLYGPASFDIDIIMDNLQSRSMLPLVTFITCGTGSFANEISAPIERLLRSGTSASNYSGGVAAIGTATLGTHTPFNNIVDMGIYHGIFSEGVETAGAALAAGELALFNTYPDNPSNYVSIFTHWNNLMGDPALTLWTDTPESFIVNHPDNLMPGSDFFSVTVRDTAGMPLEHVMVSILPETDNSAILKLTDASGMVQIPVTEEMSGSATVTVTRRNYYPSQTAVQIYPPGTNIMLTAPVIVNDQETGNGDGILNLGESALVSVPFFISGGDIPSGGAIDLTAPFAAVTGNPCEFQSAVDGSTLTCEYGITVYPDITPFNDLKFDAHLTDLDGHEWEIQVPVTVIGCQMIISQTQPFNPENGVPGMELSLNLALTNMGMQESGAIVGQIHSDNEFAITIISGDIAYNSVQPGLTAEPLVSPVIHIAGSSICGSTEDVEILLMTESGASATLTLPITFGEGTPEEPVGPDEYGYFIFGNEDRYHLAPQYMWKEIDPALGGSGTSHQLVDCGTGMPDYQLPAQIDLPFPFRFYGVEYTTVSVSTNGWFSFGSTNMSSFRNTPVPGAGGPSPIVAVFWDDLKTRGENGGCNGSSFGDVYSYNDPEGRYLILEWSGVKTYQNDDPEQFQAILYNTGDLTPSGDGEILLQYKIFNNTSNGLYLPAYNGLIHGSYSTIGFEDQTESRGLQYTFNNVFAGHAVPLQNESSVFITTRYPQNLFSAAPSIGVPPFTVTFEATDTGAGIVHEWDIDGDGIIEGEGDVFLWTYEDFGHYMVTMTQTQDGISKSEYRLNFIHGIIEGCTDPFAENYDPSAEYNDGSCNYIYGCMDPTAANYNQFATMDSENCYYMPYDELTVDGLYFNAYFGSAVELEDDLAIVGAYNDSTQNITSSGAAYIFKRNTYGIWESSTKLAAFDPQFMDNFGYSVSISGNVAAVGSYQDDNEQGIDAGSVYIYRENVSGLWEFEDKLIPSDAELSDNFGYSVKLVGDLLASTSRKDDPDGHSNQGSVYFFRYTDGEGWSQVNYLTPDDGQPGDSFGRSIDMNENLIIAGSPLADSETGSNSGRAYLFSNDGSDTWSPVATFAPINIQASDQFGSTVTISEGYLLVGSPNSNVNDIQDSGSAYLYRSVGGSWIFDDFIFDETGEPFDNFGKNIAMDGDYFSVHTGNKILIYHREPNDRWLKSAGFESPVAGFMDIDQNRIISGNTTNNSVRIYRLDEWEDWLNNTVPGDVNHDDQIDIMDVVMTVAFIMGEGELSESQYLAADLNGDGTVDVLDIIILVAIII